MADKGLSKQEKARLKEKEKFERERRKWQAQEAKKRTKKAKKKRDTAAGVIKVVAVVVLVAVVLGLASVFTSAYGFPGRFLTALTVGKTDVPAPVWAYSFYNMYRNMHQYGSMIGLNNTISAFGQDSPYAKGGSEAADAPKMTWDEYFRSMVNKELQSQFAQYGQAKKAGFKLDQKALDELEEAVKSLEDQATKYAMGIDSFLRLNYAPGITKKRVRAMEERRLVVEGFQKQKRDEFRANHPDSELLAKYGEDPGAYNLADYRLYSFAKEVLQANDGESTEDLKKRQAAADADTKKKADDFLREGRTEAGFIAAAQGLYDAQHQHAEGEEVEHTHDYDADAATLNLRKKRSELEGIDADLGAWMFDAVRKAGDTTAFETDSSVYALLVVRPSYAQNSVDFYTINVDIGTEPEEPVEGEPTEKEKAKEKADGVLAQWKELGGTKENFVTLVNEQAVLDGTEPEEGVQPGLNEKTGPGEIGVAEMDAWLFDTARKAGEAVVIETSTSYKVVYLASVNTEDFVWKKELSDTLVDDDLTAYVESLLDAYPLGHHGIGMRYAMKEAERMCETYRTAMAEQGNYGYSYNDLYS